MDGTLKRSQSWDNPFRALGSSPREFQSGAAIRRPATNRSESPYSPVDYPSTRPAFDSRGRASDETFSTAKASRPGMTIDQWLASIAEGKKKQVEKRQQSRASTVDELEAVMARVRRRADDRQDSKAETQDSIADKQDCGSTADQEILAEVADAEQDVPDPQQIDLPGADQVAKIARAMNTIADWMDNAEARSTDTSRLVLEHQERTARVLATAVSAVSQRLSDIEQQIKALESRISGRNEAAVTNEEE